MWAWVRTRLGQAHSAWLPVVGGTEAESSADLSLILASQRAAALAAGRSPARSEATRFPSVPNRSPVPAVAECSASAYL